MIIILIVAAVISAVIAVIEKETPTDVFIIMFVVILNAVLGVIQESKAEKAIEALKEMTAATSKVLRDGKVINVKSEDLVPGDVIVLEAGDAVPADARIIESNSLKCEEAALTGESVPSEKHETVLSAGENGDVPLGDRANMIYMGSTVVYGRGKAVITATGMDTEMGKIATALANVAEEKTPLQMKLAQLSKILTWLVLGICVFIFAFNVIKSGDFGIESLLNTFIIAVSLAVAAIPEGLAAVVTIVLSMGVTKMSKRAAVIRRLTAVETLGCTEVICSDKTGTLTQNKMTVTDFRSANKELLATAMTLCSDANPDENGNAVGEPTECALVNFATANGVIKPETEAKQPRIGEVPFDSMRKMMTTVHKTQDGKYIQYTKGAPDELLRRCAKILTEKGVEPLTDEKRAEILRQNKEMADKALRVLAAACKPLDSEPAEYSSDALEHDLIFVGLCGMIDPVRPEVLDAIKACRTAGIRPIMITGDHKDTAVAIALELGIISDPSQAITGAELDSLSDEEFERAFDYYSVYARVQPEHKVKIADMILADDNFATIVYAVEEGRKIYSNIRKAIQFLLSSNMSEVITIFTASVMGFTILKAPHLLWINLITDCFPALALGVEPGEKDVMQQKPRSKNEGVFAGGLGFDLVYQGFLVTLLTLAAYFIGYVTKGGEMTLAALSNADLFADAKSWGVTMAFLTMSMAEIFHSYNMRSQRHSIFTLGTHNFFLFGAMIAALALTTLVIEVPFLANMFDFVNLDLEHYFIALGLSILIIPIVEVVKLIQRAVAKKKAN